MKSGNIENIKKMYHGFAMESKRLLNEVIELAYFMRGGISYDDLMLKTPFERDLISDFIQGRLKTEKDKMFPNY